MWSVTFSAWLSNLIWSCLIFTFQPRSKAFQQPWSSTLQPLFHWRKVVCLSLFYRDSLADVQSLVLPVQPYKSCTPSSHIHGVDSCLFLAYYIGKLDILNRQLHQKLFLWKKKVSRGYFYDQYNVNLFKSRANRYPT